MTKIKDLTGLAKIRMDKIAKQQSDASKIIAILLSVRTKQLGLDMGQAQEWMDENNINNITDIGVMFGGSLLIGEEVVEYMAMLNEALLERAYIFADEFVKKQSVTVANTDRLFQAIERFTREVAEIAGKEND